MRNIGILGSTGSIGTQALDVIRNNSNLFNVVALSGNNNIKLLEKQALEFKPDIVAVFDRANANILRDKLKPFNIKVFSGLDGLIEMAKYESIELLLTSVVGMIGLKPTLAAIESGKDIALANKETLVTAGSIVMNKAKEHNVSVIPVDSEHSAIFQSITSKESKEISKIILTASGGPFRNKEKSDLLNISSREALKHPNWSMGRKISIDSSTLMNKGLEVIEAKWLFDINLNDIEVIVHPQSIIHSMVEYIDGSIIAQLGVSDMRIPIQYALSYPKRISNNIKKLNLIEVSNLTFEKPDLTTFPCLKLAYRASEEEGTIPSVLNAANEVLVDMFLKDKIGFYDIPNTIETVLDKHKNICDPTLDEILYSDNWARNKAIELLKF
ncbi:1-deoxy-D-xylulose-5-phosphate reductoisomerase [Clostridium sp. D2Q-11]|uniref:1-deoxy-D-xylulose 5-phosphate reductoisomerase n=1 Tax=Anaeromonas frigoriresistens TaxID=2683708 RepID=A0A942V4T8_9FIRM|nr:1-deoxy-D-xylulose-5-phosphate reductoisomerase [Anaeromonas frigoriresistens]MBS4539882.1 1-deoxy-D-xylulose-5-phosphate reductoisomerase [Anaeromonas frigoriresistens]